MNLETLEALGDASVPRLEDDSEAERQALARWLHSTKGALASVGLQALAKAIEEAERDVSDGAVPAPRVNDTVEAIGRRLGPAVAELRRYLETPVCSG
ncbi:hypothetical protein G3580_12630 [Nitrogeniibacter mangrovi]|uniref:HPt domain-containing protein n=1 Tax=Nitrogeniibacter mangrovi TaxID=2016596 RepID=A0A6C1B6J0_9RHOO|nr:hypothetical protein G3580_12630 [Nitrogeniibacter mangrovi]